MIKTLKQKKQDSEFHSKAYFCIREAAKLK
jgi:hypothetical protein